MRGFRDLPFIGTGTDFWAVESSGDYGTDCTIGQIYALDMIEFVGGGGCPAVLARVIQSMPRELTGLEIGFLSLIGATAAGRPY